MERQRSHFCFNVSYCPPEKRMAAAKGFQLMIIFGALCLRTDTLNLTRCYGSLGCLSTGGPFSDPRALRNLASVLPWDRDKIQTTFLLFTRANRHKPDRLPHNAINGTMLKQTNFNPDKKLVVFSHGYMQLVTMDKTQLMIKNSFLDAQDCNFIFVDWSKGSVTGYWTATANTRIVGAEIAQLIEKILKYYDFSKSSIHLLGHSLGSHIIGYAGQRVPGLYRLTALDPASPFFQGGSPEIRIDPTDGEFVECLHTDARVFFPLPVDGLGMWDPVGHVDVYVNGGMEQPSCMTLEPARVARKTMNETNPLLLARDVIVCRHQYVVRLTGGIFSRDENCTPVAYRCSNFSNFLHGRCTDCGSDTADCYQLGEGGKAYRRFKDSHGWPKRFFILTNVGPPYCMHQLEIRLRLSRESDVTEAQITFIFEDIDGKLSPRTLLHDGHSRISRRNESPEASPQAWVIGVVATIRPQLRTVRMTWISLDRNTNLKLAKDARITVYFMNRIIPKEQKPNFVDEFCGPEGFLREREELVFTKC